MGKEMPSRPPNEVEEDFSEICDTQGQESEVKSVYKQTSILLWRNFNIFRRKTKIFLFMVLTPIMICLMLRYMTNIMDSLRVFD